MWWSCLPRCNVTSSSKITCSAVLLFLVLIIARIVLVSACLWPSGVKFFTFKSANADVISGAGSACPFAACSASARSRELRDHQATSG